MTLFVIFYPYHFVHTILSMPFCPIPFCPYTILSIPFCPYHFVRYHFVLEPMKVSRKGEGVINITIDGEILEQVEQFSYLGALITSDGRCETEIKTRIGMAKNAFNQRKELLSKNLNSDIKKRTIKAIICDSKV